MVSSAAAPAPMPDPWAGFAPGPWQSTIDVRDFIQRAYTPFEGDAAFLAAATPRTEALWATVMDLFAAERAAPKGVLDVDPALPSTITAFPPGYIDRAAERIVGLQTDAPLKRALMPNGGLRMAMNAVAETGREVPKALADWYTAHRKTHNEGVFDAYTPEMRGCRKSGIITGLPDAYGRGRIIGDYRRLALYGADRLVAAKEAEKAATDLEGMSEAVIRQREELSEQIRALKAIVVMAKGYGFDVRRPAADAREAVQWTYLAYLAAIKEQNGAAMSLGRVSTFWDCYIQRDIDAGRLTEAEAQEPIDDVVIKLRMVRFLRTDEYNQLFTGDPVWCTESIAGMGTDGRTLTTRTSFRILHTLRTLGPSPEPNLTVLWSEQLPEGFKRFCADISITTSSIQYENDDLMRPKYGDDYGIACCVSPMAIGKGMQFFGARANLAKTLLYAINGGRDELSGEQIASVAEPIRGDVLRYDEVMERFDAMMGWLARVYVNSLNVIHYMHDRYCYEAAQMAFYDREVRRTLGCGIAGLSVVADSLSAIRHATVRPVRDARGLVVDYEVEGEYPAFGNADDRVDALAVEIVGRFMDKIRSIPTYRNAIPTQSVLTITSNVVYGKKTGSTPDGRKHGEPFAPGANPMHGRDRLGAVASLTSVAKLPFDQAEDGISNTFSILPEGLGRCGMDRCTNLTGILDGYFAQAAQHVNVNVLNRETLRDAMAHPERHPQLTVRVSGYAVHFIKLTREQQEDVVNRTFHEAL
jgi:formate C-acetyltransferase